MCIMRKNSLIIDGNAVYELDMDCLQKRRQLEERSGKQEKKRQECNSNRISIRTVDEA